MTLEEAMVEINNTIRCVPWEIGPDPSRCPNGEPYEEFMWIADHEYYGSPEFAASAVCKMLASKIRYDRDRLLKWSKVIDEDLKRKPSTSQPVLYWRVEPEYEIRQIEGSACTVMYARYAMVMDGANVSRETQEDSMTEWRSIKSAPRDQWVLVRNVNSSNRPYIAKWAVGEQWMYGEHFETVEGVVVKVVDTISPTDWSPMPELHG